MHEDPCYCWHLALRAAPLARGSFTRNEPSLVSTLPYILQAAAEEVMREMLEMPDGGRQVSRWTVACTRRSDWAEGASLFQPSAASIAEPPCCLTDTPACPTTRGTPRAGNQGQPSSRIRRGVGGVCGARGRGRLADAELTGSGGSAGRRAAAPIGRAQARRWRRPGAEPAVAQLDVVATT